MNDQSTTLKPPTWFWVVAVIALLWNLAGVAAYLMQVTMSPEAMATLSDYDREMLENMPIWVTSAYAIAVWGGLVASIFLVLKKSIAIPLFIVSLIAVVAQFSYMFLVTDILSVKGGVAAAFPTFIFVFGIFLIWFSRKAKANGWII